MFENFLFLTVFLISNNHLMAFFLQLLAEMLLNAKLKLTGEVPGNMVILNERKCLKIFFLYSSFCVWKPEVIHCSTRHIYGNAACSTMICNDDTIYLGSQAGVVDINHAFHLYYKCCMWAEFKSISSWSRGFSPVTPVSSLLKIDSH